MFKYIKNLIKNKNYKKLILISVIALGLAVGAVLSALAVGKFLIEKSDTIILGGSVIVVAVYFINRFFQNRSEEQQRKRQLFLDKQVQVEKQNDEAKKIAAETSYNVVRECLYLVLRDTAESLKLIKPVSVSSIDTPYHFIDKGTYILLCYKCQKNGICDVDMAKNILNERFRQKLSENEFPTVKEKNVYFEGRYYPIFLVDSVTDVDDYVNINVAICNENYCLHLQNKETSSVFPQNHNDKDF